MKFHLLPIGSHFRLNDENYIKSTPLVGENTDTGEQKLIRRATVVEPIQSNIKTEPAHLPDTLPASDVASALGAYHDSCMAILSDASAHLPEEMDSEFRSRLDFARRDCLARLGMD